MIENTFGMNIIPENDSERLVALGRYRIMDTPSEASFDNLAKLCTKIFNVPISLVSLVDAERVFFKANAGMGKAKEANRGKSLCALAVLDPEVTVFEDALKEPCLIANPNVAGDFGLRFYAGAPLITHDGFLIGTLCIIDQQPRNFSAAEREMLSGIATAVMDQIELRISALEEIDRARSANLLLSEHQEELQVINEELTASNEELRLSQEEMNAIHHRLTESESRFRNLVRKAPVAIATYTGRDMVIEQANEQMLGLWGKTESVIGMPLLKARPEMAGHPYLEILAEVFATGNTHSGFGIKGPVYKDGVVSEGYYDAIYKAVLSSGEVTGIMVVATDVTEKTLALLHEQELHEEITTMNEELTASNEELQTSQEMMLALNRELSESVAEQANARMAVEELNQRLEIALDAGKLGSTEVDLATGIMQSTDQFKANYGYQKHETFNYPDLFNVMLPEHRERVKGLVQHAIATNGIYQAEYAVKWPDGSVHWISAHGRPRYDEHGKANRMVGMNADITESKLFEQRKDDFLSIASHELKTPITSLKASLQLLDRIKEKPFSSVHIKLIDQSNRSMEKMSVLVDDLLNMNRMTEGQLKLAKNTFTIAEMLNQCCNHVRIEGKYQLIIDGDLDLQIHADEHRIDQVVVNFVNNAVKYAPESKEIYLNVEKLEGYVKVSVRDMGPGIESHILPNLFDRYYRASYEGQSYTGLGLGLYICSEIIKRHGGEIGAESVIGTGSTFWFTLPVLT